LGDEAMPCAAFALHAISHTSLNHRSTDARAAVRDEMWHRMLDAAADRRSRILPASANVMPAQATQMLDFRMHAGLHDRPADCRPAVRHRARAGMRGSTLRQHRDGNDKQAGHKSCKGPPV
jgi:hypothetical protein